MSFLYGSTDLTSKEWAITSRVSEGHTNAQIAAETELTEDVVKNNLRTIFDKTGCWNRTEVALWYLKIGVQKERRFNDRRGAKQETSDEHRRGNRRRPPHRSPRANERHEVNVDE
jgi:DNA-binding CsgD family transcriptional regulator